MKKLLVIGAGFLQTFVIKKAKEMGYTVLTVDANPNAEGFAYADKYAIINIVDEQACAHEEFVVWCDFEIECFAVELFSAEFA